MNTKNIKNNLNLKLFNQKSLQILVVIITSSIMIKVLALLNRIILNRILGLVGTSLYTLIIPSIMLFVSLGSFSLSTSINQIIAKEKNQYNKSILKNGLTIALITSSISSLILLVIIKPLSYNWLQTDNAFYPILSSIPLIFLSSISSVLRGIYNGMSKIIKTYISILIEQIVRITTQIIFLSIIDDITKAVTFAILSMSIGELASIIFLFIKLNKVKNYNDPHKEITKTILSSSIPTTLTHLISSFSNFLEPIIITFTFTYLNFNMENIRLDYSEITSFIIPMITMFIFITSSITPLLIQKVSFYKANKKNIEIRSLIKKTLFIISVVSVFILSIMLFYGNDLIKILYNVNITNNLIRNYSLLFIFLYLESPLIALMQGLNENKRLFIIVIISSIIKLVLIIIIPLLFKEYFNTNILLKESIMISYIISFSFFTLSLFNYLKKKLDYKVSLSNLVLILIYSLLILSYVFLINKLEINILYKIVIDSIIFLFILLYLFKSIDSSKKISSPLREQ